MKYRDFLVSLRIRVKKPMLNVLLGSAAREKLLNYFVLSPERSQSLTLLARDLGLAVTTLRTELNHLVAFGLMTEEVKPSVKGTGQKYYRVNESFVLYPEIRSLFIKAQILSSERFIKSLTKAGQIKFLALTGLFTNYPEAQTDILLVGNIRRPIFVKLLQELEKDLGREINYTILSEREFAYRRSVMDIFLYNILEGNIITLQDELLTQPAL